MDNFDIEANTTHKVPDVIDVAEEQQPAQQPFNLQGYMAQRETLRASVQAEFSKLQATKKFDRGAVVKCVAKIKDLVGSLDQLCDVVINDLMIVDKRFGHLEQQLFTLAQQHTVLRAFLEDTKVVTKEGMSKIWEEKVKPEIEAKIAQAKSTTAELQTAADNLVQPMDSRLVDPSGNPIT